MAKDIEPRLKLISEYLKINQNELFVIPEYQRSYSWGIDQCDKLWQDIESFIESGDNDPYFFGTVIVDCSEPNRLSLIDGQQRTTTFLLLLKAMLLRLREVLNTFASDEESEALEEGLKEKRNKIIDILYKTDVDGRIEILRNWEIVRGKTFLENRSINEQYKSELQLIIEAEDYRSVEQGCFKIPRRQKDNKYTNFFRNFRFFYDNLGKYKENNLNKFAKTFLEKCQIIEIRSWQIEQAITMFNSLNSTGMPLSDADIISARMYSNVGDDKSLFNSEWEKIINLSSELASRKIVSIDSILQQFMYITRAKEKEYMKKGYLDVTTPGIRKYYTVDHEQLLKNPMSLCDSFLKIAQIWDLVKDYSIVKLLLKFNENAKTYLIAYLNRYNLSEISDTVVVDIAECLLRLFAILELVDSGFSSTDFKSFLYKENLKLVDTNCTIDEIKNDFDIKISESWQIDLLREELLSYRKSVLVFLNEYLYSKQHKVDFHLTDSVNVEHIMPASGNNIISIRKDANIDSEDEFYDVVNKLGNKILLEENINKSIGNEWFKTKKQNSVKDKSGYKDSNYPIATDLVNYYKDVWLKDDIDTATNKAANRLLEFIFNCKGI